MGAMDECIDFDSSLYVLVLCWAIVDHIWQIRDVFRGMVPTVAVGSRASSAQKKIDFWRWRSIWASSSCDIPLSRMMDWPSSTIAKSRNTCDWVSTIYIPPPERVSTIYTWDEMLLKEGYRLFIGGRSFSSSSSETLVKQGEDERTHCHRRSK